MTDEKLPTDEQGKMPVMRVVPIDELIPDAENYNDHTEEGVALTELSMGEYKFVDAGTVDTEGNIINGHSRLEVAKKVMGAEDVLLIRHDGTRPVMLEVDVDANSPEGERLKFLLNETAHRSYNPNAERLQAMQSRGVKLDDLMPQSRLEAFGLAQEMADRQQPEDAGIAEGQSEHDRLREYWGTELGQRWAFPARDGEGIHILVIGDSTDKLTFERLMDGLKAHCIITDPPYNVSYVGKTGDALTIQNDAQNPAQFALFLHMCMTNTYAHCEDGGAWYVFSPAGETLQTFGSVLKPPNGIDMVVDGEVLEPLGVWRHTLVWYKTNNFVMGRCDYHYRHEPILYGWKEGAPHHFIDDRTLDTILKFDRPMASTLHPTMKPVDLVKFLLTNSTRDKEVVLDPFAGSGTTLLSCEYLGRYCRTIELSPIYAAVILQRYAETFELDPYML